MTPEFNVCQQEGAILAEIAQHPAPLAQAEMPAVGHDAPSTLRWTWQPYAIVFVSSACIMILELTAGRIVAPYVGVSLYTWTSIIGVVLAGISLGNYIGGRLADRAGSLRLQASFFCSPA